MMWMAVLKGLPWRFIGKAAGFLVIVLGILWAWNSVASVFEAKKTLELEVTRVEGERDREALMRSKAEELLRAEREHIQHVLQLHEEYRTTLNAIQEVKAAQVEPLEDRERLQKVAEGKPTLVQKLANKATKERFDELEKIYSDDG